MNSTINYVVNRIVLENILYQLTTWVANEVYLISWVLINLIKFIEFDIKAWNLKLYTTAIYLMRKLLIVNH